MHFYKCIPICKCDKIFWPVTLCNCFFPNVYCSVSMTHLWSQQSTSTCLASVGFSFGNGKLSKCFSSLLLSGWLSGSLSGNMSVRMHIEIILKNSGGLRTAVWLTDTFTTNGHLRRWFIWSVNVVVLWPCHPIIASTALLFYVTS